MLAAICAAGQITAAVAVGGLPPEGSSMRVEIDGPSSSSASAVSSQTWTTVGTFTFDYDEASVSAADVLMATRISARVEGNAALRIGVDGSTNSRGIGPYSRGLRDRRVEVVRESLISAGVPAYLIEIGTFDSSRATDTRSVDVLLRMSD
jgi:outer membrane protein OmpA-like peptidoglycan-associated protein